LAEPLAQGGELLRASSELADRVLVVFTDGEAHDSIARSVRQAQRLNALGIHLILVAEGGRAPARIPLRDEHGTLLGHQKDDGGNVIETWRRDESNDRRSWRNLGIAEIRKWSCRGRAGRKTPRL